MEKYTIGNQMVQKSINSQTQTNEIWNKNFYPSITKILLKTTQITTQEKMIVLNATKYVLYN